MNKKLYAVLLLFLPVYLLAQGNYKAGVIVNTQGDTVHGFINYKEWIQNPTAIEFRDQNTGASKNLGVSDVQFFRINGYAYYRRYQVNISLNNTDVQQLTNIPDTSTKTDTVFLKIIQDGKNASLFSYTDNLKTRFYILDKKENKPEELKYLLYLGDDNGIVTRKIYQGQLSVLATNNHIDLSSAIANINYRQPELAGIVSKINGEQNAITMQNSEPAFRFYAGLSGSLSTLTFSSPGSNALITGSCNAFAPQIAVGFDGLFDPNVGRTAIRVELSASAANYSIVNESTNSVGTVTKTSSQLKQYDVAASSMIVYNFYNTRPLKIYVSAGLKLNFPFYPTNLYSVEINNNPVNTSTTQGGSMNSIQMGAFYLSIPVNAGITINKHLNIYAGYHFSTDIISYESTNGKITGYQAGVNFFFGK